MSGAREEVGSAVWIAASKAVVDPTDEGARELGRRYWAEMPRCTRGLVRVRAREGRSELVLAGAVTLFRFGAAEVQAAPDHVECRFPIVAGLFVASAGGSLTITQRTEPPQVGIVVAGYRPRLSSPWRRSLRRLLYTQIQERLHLAVSRRCLERIAGGGA